MGSYLSVLFGGEQEDDAGAATLLELLDDLPGNNNHNNNNAAANTVVVNWDAMGRRLRRHPEEAAAFCHTVDPSPLLQCLASSVDHIPVRVIQAFVSAYDDAVHHADQQGTTPLLAAVRRTTTTTTIVVVTANDSATATADNNPPQQETNTDDLVLLWRNEARQIIQLLLQVNPGAARQADRSGVVPLHHVRGDATVAQQLYEKNPTAIEQRDCQGRLPLHYYCRLWQQDPPQQVDDNGDNDNDNENGEAQQQQQDEEEDAVIHRPQQEQLDENDDNENENDNDPLRQRRNNPPQHQQQQQTDRDMHMMPLPNPQVARLLVGGSKPIASTRTLSATTPTTNLALLKDSHGVTPLDILYQELQTTLHLLHNNTTTTTTHTSTNNQNPNQRQRQVLARAVDTLWEILIIVVHAAVGFQTFQMVHALVALHCPPTVMAEALRRYPQQALERDALGRTPLLLAVEMLDHNNNNNNSSSTTTTTTTTTTTMKDHQEERAAAVCRELIRFNPVAARMTDREGRLAIDVLSEKGFYNEELFEAFVKAEPRAIDTRDLKNKQHPFLTAALAPDNKSNVAIVYHLLRAKPHVIQYFLDDHK